MITRVAAYAVIVQDDQMLLTHWNGEGGWRIRPQGAWTLPGGGLDHGEDPEAAAVREVWEETGYDITIDGLIGVDSIVVDVEAPGPGRALGERAHGIRIIYRGRVVGGELRPEPPGGSTDQVAWHRPDDLDALDRAELVDAGRRFAGLLG